MVPINEDQLSRVRLLYALRQRLLLVPKDDGLVAASCSMASTHGRVCDDLLCDELLLLKASCGVHTIYGFGVAGAGARSGTCCRRRSNLHVVTV